MRWSGNRKTVQRYGKDLIKANNRFRKSQQNEIFAICRVIFVPCESVRASRRVPSAPVAAAVVGEELPEVVEG